MTRPFKHPRTGVYWLRQRVPADLRHILGRAEVTKTLGTKDPAEAKVRLAAALATLHRDWEMIRRGPQPLSQVQVVAVAGEVYRETVALGGQVAGGDASVWVSIGALYGRLSDAPEEARERFLGSAVDPILARHGLLPDAASRSAIFAEVIRAELQAAEVAERMAEGDFSPDPKAARFPPMPASSAPSLVPAKVSLTGLLELWEREHEAGGGSASTRADWRRMVEAFVGHLGHADAEAVTPKDVDAWADHLRHERKLSAKTINGRYLAAIGSVYRLGIAKHRVKVNPADKVEVRAEKPHRTRSKGFTEGEAKAVLKAALAETDVARKWLPWLAAYTGARINELAQLRREDFREEEGIAFARISPAAGTVKTGLHRDVPLHPHLLDLGLLEWVERKRPGQLFPKNAAQVSARFVRRVLDLPEGRGELAPNHGWRHRFKTVAREAGIPRDAADAIQGHADGSASAGYGEWSVNALQPWVSKLPRVAVE